MQEMKRKGYKTVRYRLEIRASLRYSELNWRYSLLWQIGKTSVQFSRSVVSDSLRPHEPQDVRPPCPSPTLRVYPNPCPLSRWCHPTISSSVVPFSSCPQSFLVSVSFPMSQLFASGGQSIGVSASASVLAMNTQDRSPLGWTGWISLKSKGLSRVFSNTIVQKRRFFGTQLSHPYMTTGKLALIRRPFVGRVTFLLFNMLSRLVIAFLPRSEHLNFMAAVTICSDFGAQENKVCHCLHCFPIYLPRSDGTGCCDLHFLNVEF